MKQQIKIVFHPVIVRPAPVFEFFKTGGKEILRLFIRLLQFPVQRFRPLPVHIAEHVHIIAGQDLFRRFRRARTELIHQTKLQDLHDPVSQVVSAEIRIAVFVGRVDLDPVGYPLIPHPEGAGAQIRRASPAVDDQRMVRLSFFYGSCLSHSGYGIVQDRDSLVDHILLLHRIIRQNLSEHPAKLRLLFDGTGHMNLRYAAFELISDRIDHIFKIGLQDFLSGHGSPASMPVRDLFLLFAVSDPPLDVVEHAEALVNIAGFRQADGVIAEEIFRLSAFHGQYRRHAGKQGASSFV